MRTLFFILMLVPPLGLLAQSDNAERASADNHELKAKEYEYLIKANRNIEAHNFKEATRYIDSALAINAGSADAFNTRGLLKTYMLNYKGAVTDFSKAIRLKDTTLDGNLSKAFNNRGYAEQQLHQSMAAARDYNRAMAIDPENALAFLNMGNLLAADKRYAEAISYYNSAIKIDGGSGKAYNNRGLAKHFAGDNKGSCADLRKAIALGFTAARQNLAKYCN